MRDICEYLGGREDKDFLGSGNLGLVIQPQGTRLLFLQRWQDSGLVDWAAGSIRAWAPDRIELVEPLPGSGLHCSSPPARRWVFMAREDVLGMTLEWVNDSLHELVVQVELSGRLPGLITSGGSVEPWLAYAQAVYSERVTQPVFYALGATGFLGNEKRLRSGFNRNDRLLWREAGDGNCPLRPQLLAQRRSMRVRNSSSQPGTASA